MSRKQAKTATATITPTNFDAAKATFCHARQRLNCVDEAKRENRETLRLVERELATAVRQENYGEAERLKKMCDDLKAAIANQDVQSRNFGDELSKAYAVMNESWFKTHPVMASPVTVRRVTVVDPETENTASAEHIESGETIQLSLNGESFENEAWHVDEWASRHGFVVHRVEATISF